MPRVRPLTKEQRRDQLTADLGREVSDILNADRGRRRMTHQDYAEELGMSRAFWSRCSKGDFSSMPAARLVAVLDHAGYKLEVVPKCGRK